MSKPPKQKWIAYLFSCMDADPAIQPYTWEFQYIADKVKCGKLSKEQANIQLQNLREMILPTCKYQHHSEKIIDGTIQFIFKTNFEY